MCSLHNTAGWQLCITTTFIWDTDDDIMPNSFTTALCYLLQIWNGVEDQWCGSQRSQSERSGIIAMNLEVNSTVWALSGIQIVAVSGTWMPLSSVCRSCGITTETVSGEMTLVASYNRGPCVTTEVGIHPPIQVAFLYSS